MGETQIFLEYPCWNIWLQMKGYSTRGFRKRLFYERFTNPLSALACIHSDVDQYILWNKTFHSSFVYDYGTNNFIIDPGSQNETTFPLVFA